MRHQRFFLDRLVLIVFLSFCYSTIAVDISNLRINHSNREGESFLEGIRSEDGTLNADTRNVTSYESKDVESEGNMALSSEVSENSEYYKNNASADVNCKNAMKAIGKINEKTPEIDFDCTKILSNPGNMGLETFAENRRERMESREICEKKYNRWKCKNILLTNVVRKEQRLEPSLDGEAGFFYKRDSGYFQVGEKWWGFTSSGFIKRNVIKVNIEHPQEVTEFLINHIQYDDLVAINFNGHKIVCEPCPCDGTMVKIGHNLVRTGTGVFPFELGYVKKITRIFNLKPYLRKGENILEILLAVGGNGCILVTGSLKGGTYIDIETSESVEECFHVKD